VHRVEFEINREDLGQFSLVGTDETMRCVGDIWAYCTSQWLTHRSPIDDANRARWPCSAEWSCVQSAQLAQKRVGAERVSARLRCGSLRKLTPGLTGYLVSSAALSGTSGVDDTVAAVGHPLRQEEIARGVPFTERVRMRRLQDRFR
jgi:hypothetical protein